MPSSNLSALRAPKRCDVFGLVFSLLRSSKIMRLYFCGTRRLGHSSGGRVLRPYSTMSLSLEAVIAMVEKSTIVLTRLFPPSHKSRSASGISCNGQWRLPCHSDLLRACFSIQCIYKTWHNLPCRSRFASAQSYSSQGSYYAVLPMHLDACSLVHNKRAWKLINRMTCQAYPIKLNVPK